MKYQRVKNAGEVAAIVGYEFQYSIFATEIYNSLLNEHDSIEWIEFASSEAGKIDDVLIGLEKSVKAYQVKAIDSSTFSYKALVSSNSISILEGMVNGWKKIKTLNPHKQIDIKFISIQSPSENDKIISYAAQKKPSFKDFLNLLWIPIKNGRYGLDDIPKKWKPVFQEMVDVSKSSATDFIEFIKCTTFVFNYEFPRLFDEYIERQRRIDIEDITRKIFHTIAQKRSIRLSKKEFLEHFGFINRYESYHTHSFFVDESHYQSITDTVNQLEILLKTYSKGYISLIGNAGSGKSTLLTKWLQNSNYKIFKYYSYVNTDMSYEHGFRGEAKTFLHDILIQIRQSKYSIQERLPSQDFEDLQKHFNNELNKLSREEEKVIIIVDGLDHIEREQDVSKSLITILPLPDNIPNNVYFLLGSRTVSNLEKLHVRIKENLEQQNRIISIKALSRFQTQSLLQSHGLVLTESLFEKLYVNTKGHPLFLRYTIEEIKNKDNDVLEEIITQKIFSGDIYNEYKVFWNTYKTKEDFIEILGILSRLRHSFFSIDILSLFPHISRENQYSINKLSENYFYKIGSKWQFFHSSFKEFLIDETAKNILTGLFDKSTDREFHLKISNAIKDDDGEYKWNVVYHLYKAENYLSICQLVSQDYFRQQWFQYRSYKLIKEDIQFAIQSSLKNNDIYCLFRSFLSVFELKQRYMNFDPSENFRTFHYLEKISLANSFVYDEIELLVSQESALKYAEILYKQGLEELAYDIFQRATPNYILTQSKSVNTRKYDSDNFREIDELDLIVEWSRVACLFSSVDSILTSVKNLSIENENHLHNRNFVMECISAIIDISIKEKKWDNLSFIERILINEGHYRQLFHFYYDILIAEDSNHDYYLHSYQTLQNWDTELDNSLTRKLILINIIYFKNLDLAKRLFTSLKIPSSFETDKFQINEADYLNYIFDYSRFFYILTKEFSSSPTFFLPVTEKHSRILFYYAFAELGKSYAYLYYSYNEAAASYYLSFEKLLKLFHLNHMDDGYDYAVFENKPLLVNLILKISARSSITVFNEMLIKLTLDWDKNENYWRTKHKQEVIEWVIESKLNFNWCQEELEKIDSYIFIRGYLDERIEKGLKQIQLWSSIGMKDKGEDILRTIMIISLNVRGEKDNQLDYIVSLTKLVHSNLSKEINFYLSKVKDLRGKVNSSSHTPATDILMLSLYHGNGFEVFKYLLFNGLVDFGDSLETIFTYLTNKLPQHNGMLRKLFTRILVAFDNNSYSRHLYLNQLFSSDQILPVEDVKEFVNEIFIYSATEVGSNYLVDIKEYAIKKNINLEELGLDRDIKAENQDTEGKESELQLYDGSVLPMQSLITNIKTGKQLREIEEASKKGQNFNWAKLYGHLVTILSDVEILEIIEKRRLYPNEIVDISNVLIEENRVDLAKKILNVTIERGERYGWVTFIDGGSKILPFKLLSTIEEKSLLQAKALNDFGNCISSFDVPSYAILIRDILEIWTMFSDNVDVEKMHEEIVLFRNELLKNHQDDMAAPKVNGCLEDEALLVEILLFIITFPSDFNDSIYEILQQQYLSCKSVSNQILKKLYLNGFSFKYVKLLSIISTKHKDILLEHKENLAELVNHARYDVFKISCQLLKTIDVEFDKYHRIESKEIPFVYAMHLEYQPSIYNVEYLDLKHINEKGFLKETNDPLVLVKLYIHEIRMLSRTTGFKIINIAHRVMILGNEMEFPDWCSSLSEEEIRRIYSGVFDLEISYKRPRNQLVWDGLMKVVKELFELKLIDKELADEISDDFDADVCLINIQKKPEFITSILEGSTHSAPTASKEWAEKITNNYLIDNLKLKVDDESIILAEHSFLRGMGWGYAEERRQSFVDLVHDRFESDSELIFNFTSEHYIQNYPNLRDQELILYNGLLTMNHKRNWLAINPLLCKELGLIYNSSKGKFRWDDNKGNPVVESIYWQEHSVDNFSKHHHSEAGYGWYVILHKNGIQLFKSYFAGKILYHHRKISRFMKYSHSRYNHDFNEKFNKCLSEKIEFTSML